MKAMLVLAVVATTVTLAIGKPQFLVPGFYAPGFPYAPRTALDAIHPSLGLIHNPFVYTAAPTSFVAAHSPLVAAPAPVAAAPAAVALNAAPVAPVAPIAPAVTVKATEEPAKDEPVLEIRRIFPVFGTDLRSGSETITFLRPDQINPVKTGDSVTKVETAELPGVVVPDFDLRSASPVAPVIPAGIVQATQPRFITARAPIILA